MEIGMHLPQLFHKNPHSSRVALASSNDPYRIRSVDVCGPMCGDDHYPIYKFLVFFWVRTQYITWSFGTRLFGT